MNLKFFNVFRLKRHFS